MGRLARQSAMRGILTGAGTFALAEAASLVASPALAFTNCQVSYANVLYLADACARGDRSSCGFLPEARSRQGDICTSPSGADTFPATVARALRPYIPHENGGPVPGYDGKMGAPSASN